MKSKLIIMVGNIASGKTTWIKNYLDDIGYGISNGNHVVLSYDSIRRMIGAGHYTFDGYYEPIIHTSILNMLANFMVHDVNIIIDDNGINKSRRDSFLNFTTKRHNIGYDYETIAVIMPKLSKIKSVARRIADAHDAKDAQHWNNVWDYFNDLYEEPTKEEGFDYIWRLQ